MDLYGGPVGRGQGDDLVDVPGDLPRNGGEAGRYAAAQIAVAVGPGGAQFGECGEGVLKRCAEPQVVVWDSDPVLPVARASDAGRVGQHGLEIVMAVAQGVEARRDPVGKRITARVAVADAPGLAGTRDKP
ncbi:hypothetical protein [Streptomyces sp. NPDC052721]|uniref:hypothetical protein n=1 Tax=Streptomyces sp. NPDC052721 TaxID=3154955 RepID=UPI003420B451